MSIYADVENVIKLWLMTTQVTGLLTRSDGGVSIFLTMPKSTVIPSVIVRRVGGGPQNRKELPLDRARVSLSCWGTSRASAGVLSRMIVAECDELNRTGGWIDGDTAATLGSLEPVGVLWLPDPVSDTPRYIVDAIATTMVAT